MFWNTAEPHGLPHDPFKSCVVPRPIGWISTVAADGAVNLAPYSFFNGVAADPPMVMFASGARGPGEDKDSIANAMAAGEFVCNMVAWDLRRQMNQTSAPLAPHVNEFDIAGLDMEPSRLVAAPRVKAAPIHLECTTFTTLELPPDGRGGGNAICVGRVVGVHVRDAFMKEGLVDIGAVRPVARMGYMDYTSVEAMFTMARP